MTKYKSAVATITSLTTPTGVTTKTVTSLFALNNAAGAEFYRVGGGLQDINFGVTPNLGVDLSTVIVRGGILHIQVSCPTLANDPVVVTVELRRARQQSRNAADAATSNTLPDYTAAVQAAAKPLTWTYDDAPDRQEYLSKAYLSKTMVLAQGQMMAVQHKLKIEKWDTADFERGGKAWIWIVTAHQVVDAAVVGETVQIVTGHDLSFTASSDAI